MPGPSVHASPGEKLRYYRELKQMSQEELSRKLGHDNLWYIVNLEKGFNPIFYEDAVRLAEVLDIDPEDLLTEYTRFCKPGYGARIKRIRHEYQATQAEFSEMADTERAHIAVWECEYHNIHPEYSSFLKLKKLAEDKSIDFQKLIDDEEYCIDDYERFIKADIPKKVRNIRSAYGMFQRDFAKMLGCIDSGSAVSQWESGKGKPLRKTFYKLRDAAVAVGIDMNKLNEDPDFYRDEYAEFIETDCGDKIRYIRLKHDLYMEQFGEMIGVAGSTVGQWETGGSIPTKVWFPEIKKAAEQVGIDLDSLNGHPEIYKDPFTELIQKQDSAEWVRRIRKESGLTIEDFARYVGVSTTAVWQWETDKKCWKPGRRSFDKIVEIAVMKGIDIYDTWGTESVADRTAAGGRFAVPGHPDTR